MTDRTVDEIAELGDDEFHELIRQHIHPVSGDAAVWAILLSPSLQDRTAGHLRDMNGRVDSSFKKRAREADAYQLECLKKGHVGRRDWQEYYNDYQAWRKRAGAFKQMVAGRAAELKIAQKRTRAAAHEVYQATNSHNYREVIRQFAVRIHQHQALTARSGREPEQHDYDLWRLLDELSVPVGPEGNATIRDMMRTYWFDTSPATVQDGTRRTAERLMRQAPAGRSEAYQGIPKLRRTSPPNSLT
jgi:hypothetical protein